MARLIFYKNIDMQCLINLSDNLYNTLADTAGWVTGTGFSPMTHVFDCVFTRGPGAVWKLHHFLKMNVLC